MVPSEPPDHRRPLADETQLATILARVRDAAYREAKRKVHGQLAAKDDASDLAQSVVREILAEARSLEYRGEAALRALVKKVLVAKLIEKARYHAAHKRDARREVALEQPEHADGSPAIEPPAEGRGPATILADRELLAIGRARLAELPERQRKVVEMRIAGLSHKEIGAALGISADNSERLLCDAKKALRGE